MHGQLKPRTRKADLDLAGESGENLETCTDGILYRARVQGMEAHINWMVELCGARWDEEHPTHGDDVDHMVQLSCIP